jgi:hypothetical protein
MHSLKFPSTSAFKNDKFICTDLRPITTPWGLLHKTQHLFTIPYYVSVTKCTPFSNNGHYNNIAPSFFTSAFIYLFSDERSRVFCKSVHSTEFEKEVLFSNAQPSCGTTGKRTSSWIIAFVFPRLPLYRFAPPQHRGNSPSLLLSMKTQQLLQACAARPK